MKPLNSAQINNLLNKVRKAKGENKYHNYIICINDDRSTSSDLTTVNRLRLVKYIGKGCLFRLIHHIKLAFYLFKLNLNTPSFKLNTS